MKKKLIVSLLLLLSPLASLAENLIQVYQEALSCDPIFKAAQEQYLATRENVPIARSALLPNVGFTASTERQYLAETTVTPILGVDANSNFYNSQNAYLLSVSQPLFNWSSWYALRNADATVKSAEASYYYAQQDLILRVAQAYFNVLQAVDNLRYTEAQKKAVGEQLQQTKEEYNVGLIAITGVNEAQANYDSILANEIAAKVEIATAMEALRVLTTRAYPTLMGLNHELPLVNPDPADISRWVACAEQQNYNLQAAIYSAEAARENIQVQAGNNYPVVNAVGGYSYLSNSNSFAFSLIRQKELTGGVSVSLPIYQGGLVTAKTRQASYLYQQAISNMELTHRSVIAQARDSYLNVYSGISKVKADQQAIISAESALASTKAGYSVGTRTILDVLNTQTNLYQAQLTYTQDRYAYLINTINLKEAAGTLSVRDLVQINSWLRHQIPIVIDSPGVQPGYYPEPPAALVQKSLYDKMIRHPHAAQIASQAAKVKTVKKKHKKNISESINNKDSTLSGASSLKVGSSKFETGNSPYHYTIELFLGKEEQHAKNFITEYHLENKASYHKAQLKDGKIRYIVIYGSYDTEGQAEAMLRQLPKKLRNLHPWVRKYTQE